MEFIKIELKDKTEVTLALSTFFLGKLETILGVTLVEMIDKVVGQFEAGTSSGGMLNSIDTRAAVIAAGMTAASFHNKEYKEYSKIDGYEVLENMPDALRSPFWGDLWLKITNSLFPDLIKEEEEPAKKKKAGKHTASKNSQTSA